MASLVSNLGGTAGFGENTLDEFVYDSGYIDLTAALPSGLKYFGLTITGMVVDQYGFVRLVPDAKHEFDGSVQIAPLFTVTDLNALPGDASPGGTSTGSNRVYWDFDPVRKRITITWDDVLPSDPSVRTGNAFQLILADKSAVTGTPGDFDIVLRYEAVNWINQGGFGSFASIRPDDSSHAISIIDKGDTSNLLDLPNASNIGVPGIFNYQVRNAQPTTLSVTVEPVKLYGDTQDFDGSWVYRLRDTIIEGTNTDTPLHFTLTRDGPVDAALDVEWRISSQPSRYFSLKHPVDAADLVGGLLSGTVQFAAGAATADLTLLIAGDSTVEHAEFLNIIFSSDAILASADTTVVVQNDEVVNFSGTSRDDAAYGSAANDTLSGGAGKDYITGGIGDDLIVGGPGDDQLIGGDGIDTVSYADSMIGVSVSLAKQFTTDLRRPQDTKGAGVDYLVEFENLTGSDHNDTLIGSKESNVLSGRDGNDRLDSRGGGDTLIGGIGNDTYVVWDSADSVVEQAGAGTDRILARVSANIASNVERLDLVGTAAINGTGNAAANVIVGNTATNVITGGGGADRFTGRAGADTFVFPASGPDAAPVVVTDFVSGTDRLSIEVDAGAPLGAFAGAALTDADLVLGSRAQTSAQHLIYYAKTSSLFYDPDGTGGQSQIKIAVLLGRPDLHASDFDIIAI